MQYGKTVGVGLGPVNEPTQLPVFNLSQDGARRCRMTNDAGGWKHRYAMTMPPMQSLPMKKLDVQDQYSNIVGRRRRETLTRGVEWSRR